MQKLFLTIAAALAMGSGALAQAPVALDCGVVADGNFVNGPTNFYNFSPNSGDAITVRLLAASADLGATQISVTDSAEHALKPRGKTAITTGAIQALDFDIIFTGPHQIQVHSATQTGSYKLVYTYLNRPCGQPGLLCGAARQDQIAAPLQIKTYQFAVNAGDVVSVRWTRIAPYTTGAPVPPSTTGGPAFLPYIGVFTGGQSSGGQLAGQLETTVSGQPAAGYTSGRLDVPQAASGSIIILVFDANNVTGNYGLVSTTTNRPCGSGTVSCGSATQGSIASALSIDSYRIDMAAGDIGAIRTAAAATGNSILPVAELYDPQGHQVSTTLTAVPSSRGALNFTFTARTAGSYTMLVRDGGSGGTAAGGYAVTLVRFNRPCSAQALSCASVVDGSIGGILGTNAYSVAASANDVYLLRVLHTGQNSSFRPRVDVYDPQGNPVTSLVTSDLGRQTVTFTVSGTYTLIAADGYDATQAGSYSLSIVRLNRPCGAGTLSCGAVSPGAFTRPLGFNVYGYNAAPGESFTVRMSDLSGSLQEGLQVYDAAGNPVGQAISGNTVGVDVIQPAGGAYAIVAMDNSTHPAGGPFAVDLLRTVNACGSSPGEGQTVGGLIGTAVPFLAYSFSASAGDALLLRSVSGTAGFAAQMELYDPTGARLDTQTFSLTRKIASAGNYTVIVGASAPQTAGGYWLVWQLLNNPAATTPLACGGSVSSSISGSNQFRSYSVAAASGDLMRLLLTKLTDNFSPQMELYDPTGARLSATPDVSQKSAMDGNYLVLVSPSTSSGGNGAYTLSYQRPNNPCSPAALTCGQTALRQVKLPGQLDTFTFTGTGGDRANIKLVQRSGAYTPFVELYDASGNRMGSTSSGSMLPSLPSSGGYTLLVRDAQGPSLGSYRVTLQDDTNACKVNDTEAPSVALMQPTGGEVIGGGTTYFIQWQSDDNVGVASHTVALSTDGGQTFPTAIGGALGGNVQSYAWQVPPDIAPSRNAVLRISATDAAGNTGKALTTPLTVIGSGFTANANATYTYDSLNRLVQAVLDDGRTLTYTWDAAGNLQSIAIGR